MSVAPWYINTGTGPSLKHQKAPLYNANPDKLQERFARGTKAVSLIHYCPLALFAQDYFGEIITD